MIRGHKNCLNANKKAFDERASTALSTEEIKSFILFSEQQINQKFN